MVYAVPASLISWLLSPMRLSTLVFCWLFAAGLPAIDPVREYAATPEDFNLTYAEFKLPARDSGYVNTWFMPGDSSRRRDYVFIITGSDAGNMGYSLPFARELVRNGFDVVTFDYRGFGHSSDFTHREDQLYHDAYVDDFVRVTDWVRDREGTDRIAVLAFSMGTLVATLGGLRGPVDFFVAEGFMDNPAGVAERLGREKNLAVRLPASHSRYADALLKLPRRMLLFAASDDAVTTVEGSMAIAGTEEGRRLFVFGGGHLQGGAALGMEDYVGEIIKMAEREK